MGKFDLAAAMGLAKVSNLDTVETCMIDVDLLDANPLNFFPVEDDLSDLCESIEVNGLLQPILVTPAEAGHYRIIAGHRRTAALKRLKEQDPERYRQAPCRITRQGFSVLKPGQSQYNGSKTVWEGLECKAIFSMAAEPR